MINTVLDYDVNIIDYLPPYLQEIEHLILITTTENPELKGIYEILKKELFNQFIYTCDVDGIRNFEKLLNIKSDENIDLDTRKFNIANKWGGELPYTHRNLIKKLDVICGKGQYTLEINNNDYVVNIITSIIDNIRKNILLESLRNIIPANMIIRNDNRLILKLDRTINIGLAFNEYREYKIGG